MPRIGKQVGISADLKMDAALESLTDTQKRAYALKMLEETDPQAMHALKTAEQERDMNVKLDMAQHDEEERQRNEKHYWIQIEQRGPEDTEGNVFVGASGVSYWIQKNVPVPVPLSVLHVLDNATIFSHVPISDEALGVKYIKKVKFKRYPYSRLGEATKEEVKKFRDEQDQARKAAEDITIGQETAKSMLVRDSMTHVEEAPFIPAYLQGEVERPA